MKIRYGFLATLVVIIFFIAGCANYAQQVNLTLKSKDVNTSQNENSTSASLKTKEIDTKNIKSTIEPPKFSPLIFKKIHPQKIIIQKITPKEIVKIEKRLNFANQNEVFIFRKKGDNFHFYSGVRHNQNYYEIGQAGYGKTAQGIDLSTTNLFGKSLISIKGFCGADCPINDYFAVEKGVPSSFLHLERSVIEKDLDNDGKKELLVLSPGTVQLSVITMKNGQFFESNQFFNGKIENGIAYDEKENLFKVPFGDKFINYRYTPKGLVQVV